MPTSSVAVRSLVLAVIGLGAAPALAQGPDVTTVNPGQAPVPVRNPRAPLPAPPPGPIESRIVAIPERGDARIPRDLLYTGTVRSRVSVPLPESASATTPAPAVAPPGGPAGSGTPPVVTVTPAPSVAPAATPSTAAYTPPARPIAAATPPPDPVSPPPADGALATIPFTGESANLSDIARVETERAAKDITHKRLRQIEVRALATSDDIESRKISLARALVVRSYLIDLGIKSRIEVSTFSGDSERVDILMPNTPPPQRTAASTPPPAATPPPPSQLMAAATPAPKPATPTPAGGGAIAASIPFTRQSADLNDVAKSELDRVAKNIAGKNLGQIELRAFATGADPDSRKISLARALVVRSYLIDRGVRSRIEVGAFAGDGERVDILVPNS